jgi:hypothetical protein
LNDPVEAIKRDETTEYNDGGLPAGGYQRIEKAVKSGKAMLLTHRNPARFAARKTGKNAKCLI